MFSDSSRVARTTFEAAIARSGEVIAPAMEATELSVSGVRYRQELAEARGG